MTCTKLNDFDTENPNYQSLIEAINNGKVTLDENNCSAIIVSTTAELKFLVGMTAYLKV